MTARGHRLGGLGAQTLFLMPLASCTSVSPVLTATLLGVPSCAGE